MSRADLEVAATSCETSKNRVLGGAVRSAGIFAVCRPCGIIVSIEELFGSERSTVLFSTLRVLYGV